MNQELSPLGSALVISYEEVPQGPERPDAFMEAGVNAVAYLINTGQVYRAAFYGDTVRPELGSMADRGAHALQSIMPNLKADQLIVEPSVTSTRGEVKAFAQTVRSNGWMHEPIIAVGIALHSQRITDALKRTFGNAPGVAFRSADSILEEMIAQNDEHAEQSKKMLHTITKSDAAKAFAIREKPLRALSSLPFDIGGKVLDVLNNPTVTRLEVAALPAIIKAKEVIKNKRVQFGAVAVATLVGAGTAATLYARQRRRIS